MLGGIDAAVDDSITSLIRIYPLIVEFLSSLMNTHHCDVDEFTSLGEELSSPMSFGTNESSCLRGGSSEGELVGDESDAV